MNAPIRTTMRGFTLTELVIIVAFVSIMATIALPAYQDHGIRAKVSEMILATSDIKMQIGEFAERHNTLTAAGKGIVINTTSPFVRSMVVSSDAEITVSGTPSDLGSKEEVTVLLSPTLTSTKVIVWNCSTKSGIRYVPDICR